MANRSRESVELLMAGLAGQCYNKQKPGPFKLMRSLPGPIHPKKWAIAVPDGLDSKRSMDHSDAVTMLRAAGFENVSTRNSVRVSHFKHLTDKEKLDIHSLWVHPMGIIATLESYRGWDNKKNKERLSANAIQLFFEIDTGCGDGGSNRLGRMQGSGGAEICDGGNWIRPTSLDVINGSVSFICALRDAQSLGKFVPISKWSGNGFLYVPSEYYCTWTANNEDRGLDDKEFLKKHSKEVELGQLQLLEHAKRFPGLERVLMDRAFPDTISEIQRKEQAAIRHGWVTTERAVLFAGRALEAGGYAFAPEKISSHVADWVGYLRMNEKEYGAGPANAHIVGPCGITFPALLLYSMNIPTSEGRLKDILENAPMEELLKICNNVDSMGMTFGLHCLACALDHYTIEFIGYNDHCSSRLLGEFLEIVTRRLGALGVNINSENINPLGLLAENVFKNKARLKQPDLRDELVIRRYVGALKNMDGLGLEWSDNAKWREAVVTSENKSQVAIRGRLSVEKTCNKEELVTCICETVGMDKCGALEPVRTLIEEKCMNLAVGKANEKRKTARL
jgi:hypothetical protein